MRQVLSLFVLLGLAASVARAAQTAPIPPDYQGVLETLGKTGDVRDGVLKVNLPRPDLRVTIKGRPVPAPLGFGGWVALTPSDAGGDVLMGDFVLTEDEVNPVMSALLDNGFDVTALHNHFFWEAPRIFYMHVHATGTPEALAKRLKPAVAIIDRAASLAAPAPAGPAPMLGLDAETLTKIIGHPGERTGAVYKITIGRPDITMRVHGALINARMGLNTWAAFTGTDADALVAGDVAMLEHEVTAVLKALRSRGIDIVSIHHHMTDARPMVVFLHYFGRGPAAGLARAVRGAIDELGRPIARQ